MNRQSTGKKMTALLVITPLLFSACLSDQRHGLPHAIGEQLAANAVNYNLAIEKSQNEMLLLNVIRAMRHQPLYLTDTSKVTGTINGTFSLGLSLPFGRGWQGEPDVHGPTASPTISYSTSPSMDVSLLDSQDFMAGFLKPIPPKLFAYYWNLGWESEFLLYTLVLKVEEYDPAATDSSQFIHAATFENHPIAGHEGKIEAFSSWVRAVVDCGRPKTKSGQPFQHSVTLDSNVFIDSKSSSARLAPKDLDKIAKDQGLSLTPFPDSLDGNPAEAEDDATSTANSGKDSRGPWPWTISTPDEAWAIVYKHDPNAASPTPEEGFQDKDPKRKLKSPKAIGEGAAQAGQFLAVPSDLAKEGSGQGPIFVLTLRSAEGLLFYLGELASMANPEVRHSRGNSDGKALLIHTQDDLSPDSLEPLFVVRPEHDPVPCSTILVANPLGGSAYVIPSGYELPPETVARLVEESRQKKPRQGTAGPMLTGSKGLCTGGESMHALSLLSQLVALQKSAKDFPTTSTVKVVGQ